MSEAASHQARGRAASRVRRAQHEDNLQGNDIRRRLPVLHTPQPTASRSQPELPGAVPRPTHVRRTAPVILPPTLASRSRGPPNQGML